MLKIHYAITLFLILNIAISPNPIQYQAQKPKVSGNVVPNPNNAKSEQVINCEAKCGNNNFCYQYCMGNTGASTIITIFSVIIGLILLATLISVLYARNLFIHLPCHKFQDIKAELNVVEPGQMSEKAFQQVAEKIIQNFQISQQNGNYFYEQNGKNIKIQTTVQVVAKRDYFVQLSLKGRDKNLSWKGYGYIFPRNKGQVYFWMYKLYNKKTRAAQLGQNKDIVQQSIKIDSNGRIQGERVYWQYKRSERKWKLQTSSYKQPSLTQQITAEQGSIEKETKHHIVALGTQKNLTTTMSL